MSCNHKFGDVKDSRSSNLSGEEVIRRRRNCSICGQRFTTYEISLEQHTRILAGYINNRMNQLMKSTIKNLINSCTIATLEKDSDARKIARKRSLESEEQ